MSNETPPSRTAPQFVVRMPDEEFRERIAQAAKANNRSMNAEIVARLQGSFEDSVATSDARFLLAKWNHDLAKMEVDKFTITLRLGELAASLLLTINALENGKSLPREELEAWAGDAREGYALAQPLLNQDDSVIQRLQQSAQVLMHEAKNQGLLNPTGMKSPATVRRTRKPKPTK